MKRFQLIILIAIIVVGVMIGGVIKWRLSYQAASETQQIAPITVTGLVAVSGDLVTFQPASGSVVTKNLNLLSNSPSLDLTQFNKQKVSVTGFLVDNNLTVISATVD